jgi:hypothetical protein
MDAQVGSTFTTITERIPDWIKRLDNLTAQIASRQEELHKLSNPEFHHVVEKPKLIRTQQKTGSNCTITSDTPKYRSRSMAIVYYDPLVQQIFSDLCLEIARSRNNIRKSLLEARSKSETTSRYSFGRGGDIDHENAIAAVTMKFRRAGARARVGGNAGMEPHDTVDKGLEAFHGLCETGSHHFLREGTCSKECTAAIEKLNELLPLAEKEAVKEIPFVEQWKLNSAISQPQGGEHSKKTFEAPIAAKLVSNPVPATHMAVNEKVVESAHKLASNDMIEVDDNVEIDDKMEVDNEVEDSTDFLNTLDFGRFRRYR